GATKLTYSDPTWHNWTALQYHYETQPLPTWIGWYAHQMPAAFKGASVAVMFAIERGAPFLIFAPRPPPILACLLIVSLMILIGVTGNYGFFNILTLVLCVVLLDDAALSRLSPRFLSRRFPMGMPRRRRPVWQSLPLAVVAVAIMIASLCEG